MEKTDSGTSSKRTLTDYLRLWFKWVLDPLGGFFNRLGLTPPQHDDDARLARQHRRRDLSGAW